MNRTAIAFSEIFLEHKTGFSHPESPERLVAILNKLKSTSYFQDLIPVSFEKATAKDIEMIHESDYVDFVFHTIPKQQYGYFDGDTPFSPYSLDAALYAVGAGLKLVDEVLSHNVQNGIALVRPPGHHAENDHAMGFCIFNNVAITAEYLIQKGIKRVFILDWDVHHGNGTQNAFYKRKDVFFCSLHQFPFYPGTGAAHEEGAGEGLGYTLNIPLPRGSGLKEYERAFNEHVIPAIDKFQPEFILVSAGFDAHVKDPLAGMELPTSAYEKFSEIIMRKAKEFSHGRVISFLEGGYNLSALADSVEAHLAVLHEF